jgi:hypothetical protein
MDSVIIVIVILAVAVVFYLGAVKAKYLPMGDKLRNIFKKKDQ